MEVEIGRRGGPRGATIPGERRGRRAQGESNVGRSGKDGTDEDDSKTRRAQLDSELARVDSEALSLSPISRSVARTVVNEIATAVSSIIRTRERYEGRGHAKSSERV